MGRVSRRLSGFDLASGARQLALCAAVTATYLLRYPLQVGNPIVRVCAISALLNFLISILSRRPRFSSTARLLSVGFGLAGWSALMCLTGGVRSPFTSGLFLEAMLAALAGSQSEIWFASAGAVAGLWIQQLRLGVAELGPQLSVTTAFLLVMGALMSHYSKQRERKESELFIHRRALSDRVECLEIELDEAWRLGKLGEGVAQTTHGFKNAVHSLRGFVDLFESRVQTSTMERRMLGGLQKTIDHLENLIRTTLLPLNDVEDEMTGCTENETHKIVTDVLREVATNFPKLRCSTSLAAKFPEICISPYILREVLLNVVRNAAEAMRGGGDLVIEAVPQPEALEIRIVDSGPGISETDRAEIFRLGYTTKNEGHGLGLFLSRRLLEAYGGSLKASQAESLGALISIQLPSAKPRLGR